MPLNKLLTLSTKRSGFIVSLALEKFNNESKRNGDIFLLRAETNFVRNSIDREE